MTKKKIERKRLIFLGLRRKPIKPLAWGLLCSRRPQAPSRWGEGAERLLERVLEARAGTVNSESLCAPGDQPDKERQGRERERERKKDTGTRALMEQRCFN